MWAPKERGMAEAAGEKMLRLGFSPWRWSCKRKSESCTWLGSLSVSYGKRRTTGAVGIPAGRIPLGMGEKGVSSM